MLRLTLNTKVDQSMALFARSKVERFHEEPQASGPGPGDYDPCVPKSSEYNAGAVSLGFTTPKGAGRSPSKDGSVTDGQESAGSPLRESRSYSPQRRGTRRMTVDGTRHVSPGTSRIVLGDAGQPARKLPWLERDEEKLETEAVKLREREVGVLKTLLDQVGTGYETVRQCVAASLYRGASCMITHDPRFRTPSTSLAILPTSVRSASPSPGQLPPGRGDQNLKCVPSLQELNRRASRS